MKIYNQITNFTTVLALLLLLGSCQEDDQSFGSVDAPTNLEINYNIVNSSEETPYGDGSGLVEFEATADGATNFKFVFGDNNEDNGTDGTTSHTYSSEGVNTYTATVLASGTGGATTSASVEVTVRSDFEAPVVRNFIAGGDSKTWYVARNQSGHLGVGPPNTTTPEYYAASANELADCFYDDEITISEGPTGLTFEHANQDITFFNAEFNTVGGGGGPDDQCLPYDVSGLKNLTLSSASSELPEELTTNVQLTITDGGFMGYYINTSTYEILEIEEDYMYLRALSGSSEPLAWYLKFTTNPDGSSEPSELETEFEDLAWEEEFDVDGIPDPSIWNFETGNGQNGWGNQEEQYYTEDNAVVEDGVLKITARAENQSGFSYTSSRLNTLNKFSYEYGRIEIRAKLPQGGGTWPALWMMGDNFPEVGWPVCGEIDIMEHVGNNQNEISGTLHLPGNSGGSAITQSTEVEGVSEEFNNYTVEWSEDRIVFAVNDIIYHEYINTAETPFNDPFFIILNVAMGGTLGGDIDPNFTESTMEVDYIRVFQ